MREGEGGGLGNGERVREGEGGWERRPCESTFASLESFGRASQAAAVVVVVVVKHT